VKEKITGKLFREDSNQICKQSIIRTSPNLRPQTFEVDDLLLPIHSISLGDSDQLDREIFQTLQGQCEQHGIKKNWMTFTIIKIFLKTYTKRN